MSDQVVESQRGAPLLLNDGFSYSLRHKNKDSYHGDVVIENVKSH